MAIDFKSIEKLLHLAKKNKLEEIEVSDGKFSVKIKTALGSAHTTYAMPPAQTPYALATPVERGSSAVRDTSKKLSGKNEDAYHKVISPFVGTFYSAPSPDADSYVKNGQVIKKGDVLCIVEAMKLMNEIESEVNGKIVSVLIENGQPVEYGETLFLVDPS